MSIDKTSKVKDTKETELSNQLLVSVAAAVISAHGTPIEEIGDVVKRVRSQVEEGLAESNILPAVTLKESVTDEKITCLECGQSMVMLRRHLMAAHKMSPEEYSKRWKLPAEYPMTAPGYSAHRSNLAREFGLGKQKRKVKRGRGKKQAKLPEVVQLNETAA